MARRVIAKVATAAALTMAGSAAALACDYCGCAPAYAYVAPVYYTYPPPYVVRTYTMVPGYAAYPGYYYSPYRLHRHRHTVDHALRLYRRW